MTRLHDEGAMVVSRNECGDGGDAMGLVVASKFAMLSDSLS